MVECPNCGKTLEDAGYGCPYCGMSEEIYFECCDCGILVDENGSEWECRYCSNEGCGDDDSYCPECGEELEDGEYCHSCGWPNNQGWIGENC